MSVTFPVNTRLFGPVVTFPTLTLGQVDSDGVEWFVSGIQGWDSPAPTGESAPAFRSHGASAPPWYYTPRTVTISGSCIAPTKALREQAEDKLFAAVTLVDQTVSVERNLGPRQVAARQNGSVNVDVRTPIMFAYTVPLIALDPFKYSTVEHSTSTGLPTFSGGFQPPFQVPFQVPTIMETGVMSLANSGTVETYPRWRIDGPVTNPRVVQADGEWSLTMVLADGAYVDVDSRNGSVMHNGSSRTEALRGELDPLWPGTTSVTFTADTYSADARLSVWHRDAWK